MVTTVRIQDTHQHSKALQSMRTGSVIEEFAGLGAAALAILGLMGINPFSMLCFAAILVGVSLFFDGLSVSAPLSRLLEESRSDNASYGVGTTVETIGGLSGIILAVLALFGNSPAVLLCSAAIIYGASNIIGGLGLRLHSLDMARMFEAATASSTRMVSSAADINILVGIAAVSMGIIGMNRPDPTTLLLSSMLALGLADFLSGFAIGGRVSKAQRQSVYNEYSR